jgi:hypothetical protein
MDLHLVCASQNAIGNVHIGIGEVIEPVTDLLGSRVQPGGSSIGFGYYKTHQIRAIKRVRTLPEVACVFVVLKLKLELEESGCSVSR